MRGWIRFPSAVPSTNLRLTRSHVPEHQRSLLRVPVLHHLACVVPYNSKPLDMVLPEARVV